MVCAVRVDDCKILSSKGREGLREGRIEEGGGREGGRREQWKVGGRGVQKLPTAFTLQRHTQYIIHKTYGLRIHGNVANS